MAKTNKEFRSDLAKEMFDKLQQRNEQLEKIEKSPYSEGVKEQMRKEIMENFYEQMDKMKERPGYEEAKKTHLEEIKAKYLLNSARKKRNELWKEKERLELELHNADNEVIDKTSEYDKSQINHSGELEYDSNIPDYIQNKRKKRREQMYLHGFRGENIQNAHDTQKIKIMEFIDKIPSKWDIEFVGNSAISYCYNIKFKLGNKIYKILLPDINPGVNFSDIEGLSQNEDLEKYRKEKEGLGFHIPQKEQIQLILKELGKPLNINDESNEIAMLSYLLGMCGDTYLLGNNLDLDCDGFPGPRGINPKYDMITGQKKLFLIREE